MLQTLLDNLDVQSREMDTSLAEFLAKYVIIIMTRCQILFWTWKNVAK